MKPKTFCPQCGSGVAIDEDGCCVTCGATAIGKGVDAMVGLLREKDRAWKAALRRIAVLDARLKGAHAALDQCTCGED